MNFMRLGAGLRLHAPESSSAVDVASVGHEENLTAVAGPHGADFVIELAVVIPWEFAARLPGQALHILKFTLAEVGDENMEVSLV